MSDQTNKEANSGSQETPTQAPKTYDLDQPILSLARNITLRRYRHTDAASMAYHGNNPTIARNQSMRWPNPYTVDSAHEWIALNLNPDNWRRIGPASTEPSSALSKLTTAGTVGTGQKLPFSWAICQDDKLIGSIGALFKDNVDATSLLFGYWIGSDYWRQGVMSIVLPAYIDWIWDTYPWITKMEPGVYAWNPASAALLRKCGFEREAVLKNSVLRFGKYTDLWIFGLTRPLEKRAGKTQESLEGNVPTEPPELVMQDKEKVFDPGMVF